MLYHSKNLPKKSSNVNESKIKGSHKRNPNISAYSTCPNSPTCSASKSKKTLQCPSFNIFQQKLRNRQEQPKPIYPHIKCTYRKQNQPRHSEYRQNPCHSQYTPASIDWIVHNMTVSIYKNWLRLAPILFHILAANKKQKILNIEKLIENVKREQKRIEDLLTQARKNRSMVLCSPGDVIGGWSADLGAGFQGIFGQIGEYCRQFVCKIKVFNGQIFAKQRIQKIRKQNMFAQQILSSLQAYSLPIEGPSTNSSTAITPELQRVAQSILERIHIVKYLRKNKMKINDNIVQPLRRIYKQKDGIGVEDEEINVNKVVEAIKNKYLTSRDQNKSNKKQEKSKTIVKNNSKQTNPAIIPIASPAPIQDHNSNDTSPRASSTHSLISSSNKKDIQVQQMTQNIQNTLKNCMSKKNIGGTRKKIGFIQSDEDEVIGAATKISKGKGLENYRKLGLRHDRKKKMVSAVNQTKQSQSRGKMTHSQISTSKNIKGSQEQAGILQSQSKNVHKTQYQYDNLSQNPVSNQLQTHQVNHNSSTLKWHLSPKKSQHSRTSNNSSFDLDINPQGLESGYSYKTKKMLNLRQGKVLRKRVLLKDQNKLGHNIINLQNFQQQLEAQQNVILKKKKILNLFNSLEAQGVMTTKSFRKIINYAKNIQECKSKKVKVGWGYKDEGPIPSFFRIPNNTQQHMHSSANKSTRHTQCQPESELATISPYNYLTSFHKQARNSWLANSHDYNVINFESIPKARFSDFNYDMNINLGRDDNSDVNKAFQRYQRGWGAKQNLLFDVAFGFAKQFGGTLRQKGLSRHRDSCLV